MKIIQLQAENIKGLVAVDITPEAELVVLSGPNGAGKSSVLDSIFYALTGARNLPGKPIRDGENKARIKLDLGDIVVERKFTPSGTTLTVTSANGAKYKKPQEMLDQLCGAISFDPMAFAEMPAKQQIEMLKQLIDIDVDFDDIKKQNELDYERRRDVNRDIKNLESVIDEQKKVLSGKAIPAERQDATELTQSISTLMEQKNDRDRLLIDLERSNQRCADLREQLIAENNRLKALASQLEETPEVTDAQINDQRALLSNVTELNQAFDQSAKLDTQRAELDALCAKSDTFTRRLEQRVMDAQKAIADAKLPVDGLSFTADGVIYDGIPFEQCNTATKIKVGTSLAMAANPQLRVIRIERGSWLDESNMAALQEMARENDFQIWVERVGNEPMAIRIEEGQVVTE